MFLSHITDVYLQGLESYSDFSIRQLDLVIFTKLRISGRFHKFTALPFGYQTTHANESCQFSSICAVVL